MGRISRARRPADPSSARSAKSKGIESEQGLQLASVLRRPPHFCSPRSRYCGVLWIENTRSNPIANAGLRVGLVLLFAPLVFFKYVDFVLLSRRRRPNPWAVLMIEQS
jgi:hypothetical protein